MAEQLKKAIAKAILDGTKLRRKHPSLICNIDNILCVDNSADVMPNVKLRGGALLRRPA